MRINWNRSMMIALCLWAAMEADCSMQNNPPVLETGSASSAVKAYTQDEINALYAKANEIWNHFCSGGWERYDGPVVPVLELLANRLENIRAWIDDYVKCQAVYDREKKGFPPQGPSHSVVPASLSFSEFYSKNHQNNRFFDDTGAFPSLEHYAENLKDKAALVSILADRAERVLQSLEAASSLPPPPSAARPTAYDAPPPPSAARPTAYDAPPPPSAARPTTYDAPPPPSAARPTAYDAPPPPSAARPTEPFSSFPGSSSWDALPSAASTRSSSWDALPSATSTRSSSWDALPSATSTRSAACDVPPPPDNNAAKNAIKHVLGDLLPTVLPPHPKLNDVEAHIAHEKSRWNDCYPYKGANLVRDTAKNLQEAYENTSAKIMTWNNSHSPTDPYPAEGLANLEKCYEELDAALYHRGGTGAAPCCNPFASSCCHVRTQIQRLRELVVKSSEQPPYWPWSTPRHSQWYSPHQGPGFLDLLLKE